MLQLTTEFFQFTNNYVLVGVIGQNKSFTFSYNFGNSMSASKTNQRRQSIFQIDCLFRQMQILKITH